MASNITVTATSMLTGNVALVSHSGKRGVSATRFSFAGWLPEVVTEGLWNPVIRIISESTGETVYSLRISGNSFQPGVFRYGSYTVEAGDPDTGVWRKSEGIQAWSSRERQKLVLSF